MPCGLPAANCELAASLTALHSLTDPKLKAGGGGDRPARAGNRRAAGAAVRRRWRWRRPRAQRCGAARQSKECAREVHYSRIGSGSPTIWQGETERRGELNDCVYECARLHGALGVMQPQTRVAPRGIRSHGASLVFRDDGAPVVLDTETAYLKLRVLAAFPSRIATATCVSERRGNTQ